MDPGTTGPSAPLVELRAITKRFGSVQALRGVDFDVRQGEVHALLGQNGAGKSTLIKILSGVNTRDGGEIYINGQTAHFRTPSDSRAAGIAIVYQELSLVPSMTVAANLHLGREPHNRLGVVDSKGIQKATREFLAARRFPLKPEDLVSDLKFAYRQLTEIAKALMGYVAVLVLDEPTSSLSAGEEEILFSAIRELTKQGVGVIYVTHRLQEVFLVSDRVTVLRDGRNAGTFTTSKTDMATIVTTIVGATANQQGTKTASAQLGGQNSEVALELCDIRNDRLRGVDLTTRRGEIVGLAGLIGSGRTEILETIFGLRRIDAGEMRLAGAPVRRHDPLSAIRRGIAFAPEDRHLQGLILDDTIERNTALPQLDRLTKNTFFLRRASNQRARSAITDLAIKAPGIKTRLKELSGGNQQKVVFGKWIAPRPVLLLLDEPTIGVDVGAREDIYRIIRDVAAKGASVIVVSSDLSELLLLCDRIGIVANGRIADTLPCEAIKNEEQLHHLIQEQVA
jgi:ribose transport system ATP-binding protein